MSVVARSVGCRAERRSRRGVSWRHPPGRARLSFSSTSRAGSPIDASTGRAARAGGSSCRAATASSPSSPGLFHPAASPSPGRLFHLRSTALRIRNDPVPNHSRSRCERTLSMDTRLRESEITCKTCQSRRRPETVAQDACGACATGHGEAVDGRVALYAGRRTCDRADCRPPRQDAVSWRVVEKRDSCLRFSSRLTRRVRARCPGHNETALGRPTVAGLLQPAYVPAATRPTSVLRPDYVRAATGLRPRCDRTTSALRRAHIRDAPGLTHRARRPRFTGRLGGCCRLRPGRRRGYGRSARGC